MNPIKAIYCRTVQAVLRAALPVLPYREPEIFRSCAELNTVFSKKNIQRVLIVTDEGIVRSGIAGQLEAALNQCGVTYTVYSETRPNPTVSNVEAGGIERLLPSGRCCEGRTPREAGKLKPCCNC